MAINTPQKRMSVFQLPGLMTNPFPSGTTNTKPNRQQMADTYAGITAVFTPPSNETCWIDSKSNTSTWINSKKTVNIWVRENKQTKIWIPEKEVVPCQD
jgi:hypothetical protein